MEVGSQVRGVAGGNIIEQYAGTTFSYAGPVSALGGAVAWGVSAQVFIRGSTTPLDDITSTIVQAPDFSTSGNWIVSLTATATQTTSWYASGAAAQPPTQNRPQGSQTVELYFYIKFFNTAGPDPVLRSPSVVLKLMP